MTTRSNGANRIKSKNQKYFQPSIISYRDYRTLVSVKWLNNNLLITSILRLTAYSGTPAPVSTVDSANALAVTGLNYVVEVM